jgi:hypothetical protein
MNEFSRWGANSRSREIGSRVARRLSTFHLFLRYPILFLVFGPPIFRSSAGIDATKGQFDIWAFIQVGWIAAIATRAILRLATARSIIIPKRIRSIFKFFFLLGVLFLASSAYSTSHTTSMAYSVLYFLTAICMVEFVADVYRDPPDWMQFLFALRLIALLLFLVVLGTLPFNPRIVLNVVQGAGIRLLGGSVASMTVVCPTIVIVSAFSFLHGLESRSKAAIYFLIGFAGTLVTQARGAEIALIVSLTIIGFGWAKTGKRTTYLFISSVMGSILLGAVVIAGVGGDKIWSKFNRGESAENIASASGRVDIWKFVIQYCVNHPQGMGYIAGFRDLFRQYFSLGLQVEVTHIGNSHNAFVDVLADAGWLALLVYLIMLVKIIAMGWSYSVKRSVVESARAKAPRLALQCGMALLIFCLVMGMDTAEFCVPLRASFYFQNVVLAIILGLSARMITDYRPLNVS